MTSFLIAASLDVMLGFRSLPAVLAGELVNPGSYMRLLRLQESLQCGTLANLVSRDGSGFGTELRWPHLLEAILLVLAAPFALVMPWHDALHAGGVLLGPIAIGTLGAATAWSAAPFAATPNRWLAAVAVGAATPIAGYSVPGVVHHHVPFALAIVMS